MSSLSWLLRKPIWKSILFSFSVVVFCVVVSRFGSCSGFLPSACVFFLIVSSLLTCIFCLLIVLRRLCFLEQAICEYCKAQKSKVPKHLHIVKSTQDTPEVPLIDTPRNTNQTNQIHHWKYPKGFKNRWYDLYTGRFFVSFSLYEALL